MTFPFKIQSKKPNQLLCLIIALFTSFQVLADGTEILGAPSITIQSGTDVIVAGVGLSTQPGVLEVDIPSDVTIKQVLLYWEGQDYYRAVGDTKITVNGSSIEGALIGGPVYWLDSGVSQTYRADITANSFVSTGSNTLLIEGLDFNLFANGAGLLIIVDDGTSASDIQLFDGNDLAYHGWPEPKKTTVAKTFTFAPENQDRTASLSLFVSAVTGSNSSGGFLRPSALDITVGGVTNTFNNVLDSNDGQEWDTIVVPVFIPAGETMVTAQLLSENRLNINGNPASLTWNAAALTIQSPVQPEIQLCTLVTLSADGLSDYSDADTIVGDDCDTLPQGIPVGIAGSVDATYKLQVTNTGTETLVNVVINTPDFNLVNEPIPASCDSLEPGEVCVIEVALPGAPFSSLFKENVCLVPGMVSNMATVSGEGQESGQLVSDDDPASIQCVVEPHITLRKEVSLNNGPFVDANTPEAGPFGALGSDAVYRFIVMNDGTEALTSIVINDSVLGLVNAPLDIDVLSPGEESVITYSSAAYFDVLNVPDLCDSIGTRLNTAEVSALGLNTGTNVASSDPAYVTCENPQIELLKQVSIDGVSYFNADLVTDQDVPVGIVGSTDASYRFIIKNIGSELLTDVLVTDTKLDIERVISNLEPGMTQIIESGEFGFGNLYHENVCDGTPGNKANTARVEAIGSLSQLVVSDDDPANVKCITGPAIEIKKQVKISGKGSFVDADTVATGPTGLVGDDAVYRFIVKNIGDENLTNLSITDTKLNINNVTIADLAVGDSQIINQNTSGFSNLYADGKCDSAGSKLNVAKVKATGELTGQLVNDEDPAYINCEAPVVCKLSVDQTCSVKPQANDDKLCTSSISATTLRYTGPSLSNATVKFSGKDGGQATYTGVDLESNVSILTMQGQNGYTVDAGVGNKLGSQTIITINGKQEIIHTSCSAIYVAGEPAPLDGNTPNPANSDKGDPSPNWTVVSFRQKDDIVVVEESNQGQGSDSCEIPFGGAHVNYGYKVINSGSTDVKLTSVLDNRLGEMLTSSPSILAAGETLSLSSGPVFIAESVSSSVLVSANVNGNNGIECPAADSVIVTAAPAPLLSCADGKPSELGITYVGGSCSDSNHQQGASKSSCSGNSEGISPVTLKITDKSGNTYLSELVTTGETVLLKASALGKSKFDSETNVEIINGNKVIQSLNIHTSCSVPLEVGDQHGGVIISSFTPDSVGGGKGSKGKGSKGKGSKGSKAKGSKAKEPKGSKAKGSKGSKKSKGSKGKK